MPSPRLRRWLDQLLHTHDTPQRTAAAYALGVLFGFSPLLGLHTLLGIALAFGLNLNRVAVLLGIYSNLPWILPAYYTLATMLGAEGTEDGCLVVDAHQRTTVAGLYAAGDVAKGLDQISHAMGQAGVAATTIRNDLASASLLLR